MFAKHIKALKTVAVAACLALPAIGSAAELDLTTSPYSQEYFTYGNVNVYSLPILAIQYDILNGGGTGPGNPYYVVSTPGAIQDLIVVYTGSSGTGVTTNVQGFDNSYQSPNGAPDPFATTQPISMIAPDATGKIINNNLTTTWDASVAALGTFLAGGDPVFLFNNNDTNVDQNLAIWAKLWITDPNGNLYGQYLYLTNDQSLYGTGGVPSGDATLYNGGNLSEPFVSDPFTGITDYVLSGGTVCLDANLAIQACDGTEAYKVNHNLGANQVAYAGVSPLLNLYLSQILGLADAALYTVHLELFLGCDPRIATTTCDSFKIDNGFEQLFIASTTTPLINVPEPNSLALVALALLGLGGLGWRSAYRKG